MKKKILFASFYILGLAAACGYGYMLGNSTRTTTHESDLALCESKCKPNEGINRVWTRFHCGCNNKADFYGRD